jgi:hypothetical protein
MTTERDRFEAWFDYTYGKRPPGGNLSEIRNEINNLQYQMERIITWEAQYNAALAAWSERHDRKECP